MSRVAISVEIEYLSGSGLERMGRPRLMVRREPSRYLTGGRAFSSVSAEVGCSSASAGGGFFSVSTGGGFSACRGGGGFGGACAGRGFGGACAGRGFASLLSSGTR